MSCCGRNQVVEPILPVARVSAIFFDTKIVNTNGTTGDFLRVVISRDDTEIEATDIVPNNQNGGVDVSIQTDLLNGDKVCVQTSNNGVDFDPFIEDCVIIPTPDATNPYFLSFSFDDSEINYPNSADDDIVTGKYKLTDVNGNVANIEISGTLAAMLSVNDTNPLDIDGVNGSSIITTAFGNVTVNALYDDDYNFNLNTWAELCITDQRGISSAQNAVGITCAIMADDNTYLMNEVGEPITYFQV